jgi:hypothetical protein
MDALKQMGRVQNAITPPFDHFNLVVEALNKAARQSRYEIVRDFIEPGRQGFQKTIEASQLTLGNTFHPIFQLLLPLASGHIFIENTR